MKDSKLEAIGAFVVAIVLAVVLDLIISVIVMFIWNAVIPDVCGWNTINYLQSLGICVLCSLLFKPTYNSNRKD
jgi:ABC-type bacteriocin/lantibiotic exporter with double-glycine peptidase domain